MLINSYARYIQLLLAVLLMIYCARDLAAQDQDPQKTPNIAEQLETLDSRVADLEEKIPHAKDFWDKFGVITPLLSGALVALIGFYATNVYNRRQREAEVNRKDSELLVAQVQTVEKFLPHLSAGNEESKKAALIAIAALGNAQLAVKLARVFGGSGSTGALTNIAQTESPEIAEAASSALAHLFDYLKTTVVTIHERESRRASGFVASENGLIVTVAHAIRDLAPSDLRVGLPDGKLAVANLLVTDVNLDLALIRCATSEPLPSVELAPSNPRLGSRVVALMVSLAGQLIARVGHVSNLRSETPVVFDKDVQRLSKGVGVELDVEDGSSGAPVIDDEGHLLGIIQASDRRGHTFLIAADRVVDFVREHGNAA